MTRPLNIYSLPGLRWAFQEIEGWTQFLYCYRGLTVSRDEDRVVYIEHGTYQDFLAIINYLNYTSRRFVFTALTPEPRP